LQKRCGHQIASGRLDAIAEFGRGLRHVVLLNLPTVGLARPSLALGLLKAGLTRKGIPSRVEYANLDFASVIGLYNYRFLTEHYDDLLGEWVFGEAAFAADSPSPAEYIAHFQSLHPTYDAARTSKRLLDLRTQATSFIRTLGERIALEDPAVVGCTSMFQQHLASIALLREVKSKSPNTLTIIGGANCEAEMGAATLAIAPWIDIVFSGEADESFPALCESVLDSCRSPVDSIRALPAIPGVMTRLGANRLIPGTKARRAECKDLSGIAPPDFDDYFSTLHKSPAIHRRIESALLVEGSRGCWWGEVSHCTFCGLNGESMPYRRKSPKVILEELRMLSKKYGLRRFGFVDNILDHKWFDGSYEALFDEIERGDLKGSTFFFETKTNLKDQQVAKLAKTGVAAIQPGIESLITPVLKVIRKGSSAVQGIELLRSCAERGIEVRWSFLYGFPGEEPIWYLDALRYIKTLVHLQPPLGFHRVEYHRFSPYQRDPARFGLTLVPDPLYGFLYPKKSGGLPNVTYKFVDVSADQDAPPHDASPYQELGDFISDWQKTFSFERPLLSVRETTDNCLLVTDARGGSIRQWKLSVGEAYVLNRCYSSPGKDRLLAEHSRQTITAHARDLESLLQQALVVELDEKLVALPLREWAGFPFRGNYAGYGIVNLSISKSTVD
jgi:magnesium-protoporphyrin IX monomethyl ester (oxidative) cyclase